jgi:hypothetical protein
MRSWRVVDQSPPSSGEVNNKWKYIYAPTVRLRGAEMDNFTFTFAVSASGYTQSSGSARVNKEFDRAWKDVTSFYCTYFLRHLPRGTEENHNKS